MKIGAKNIKFHRGHGDSESYSATIYVDGKKAFHASNDGWGGPDNYETIEGYDGPSPKAVSNWLAENTPKIDVQGIVISNSLDIVVGDLLEIKRKADDTKRARNQFEGLLKRKVLAFKDGKLVSYSVTGTDANARRVKEHDEKLEVVQLGDAALKERAFLAWSGQAA